MTVPAGMTMHFGSQLYNEGDTIPAEAEPILTAALPQQSTSAKVSKASTQTTTDQGA